MNRHISRAIPSALIVILTNAPIISGFHLPSAAAQTPSTTYNYLYDNLGKLTQTTDSLGNVTNLSYDALSRIKQKIQPVPATGIARPTTNLTYDGLNQLSTVVDPRNLTTTYTSDGLGNQSTLVSPDTGTSGRTFDSAGNMVTSTDARGKITTYTYDALNRVTSIAYGGGAPTLLEYDGGMSGAAYAIGHLTKITDESGLTSYAYQQDGRVVNKAQTTVNSVATVTRQVTYNYADNGQLLSMTYPSGSRVNYAYDGAGRVNQLVLNPPDGSGGTNTSIATVLLDQIVYAPFGAVQSWRWGASSENAPNFYSRTFDLDDRIIRYPLGNPALSATAVRTVAYDAGNRITGYTHTGGVAASLDQTFGYDGLGRITSFVNATGSQSYGYDATGNRIRLSIGGISYTNAISTTSNRLTSTTGPLPAKSNVIDAAGNLASDGTTNYLYGDRGRLKSATKAGYTTNYLYNGLGQRVSKTGAEVVVYFYDEEGQLIGEYDASGKLLTETIWLGATPVVVLKPSVPESAVPLVYYIYTDHLSTPRIITDSASVVVWSWIDADPFGTTQPIEFTVGSGGNFKFHMRFPGQYFDRETGLHYNYFRDYDPPTGRYVQSDPIGLAGGINTYSYVLGNPLGLVDPTGLEPPGGAVALRDYMRSIWPSPGFTKQTSGATRDFVRNYNDMRTANTIGADKYFHCKANCEATQRGWVGNAMACVISDAREGVDQYVKMDPASASQADQVANMAGRSGAASGGACEAVCGAFRPNGLPSGY